jgi:hypothetical protein
MSRGHRARLSNRFLSRIWLQVVAAKKQKHIMCWPSSLNSNPSMWSQQDIHFASLIIFSKYIIIIIVYLSWSWATCWPVPVSRVQKPLQKYAMVPSASRGIVFHYPG